MSKDKDKGKISLKVFLRALREDDQELVQNCISQGMDVNGRTKTGASPLHVCTYHGAIKSLPILLNSGANPFALYIYNETILHVGCFDGNEEVMGEILDFSLQSFGLEKTLALLMSQDTWGNTLLHTIATNNFISVFKVLLNFLKPIFDLIEKSDDENAQELRKLLQQFVDSQDSDGDTSLHILIRQGHLDLLSLFLQLYPNPVIENNENKTALDLIHDLQSNTNLNLSQSSADRMAEISQRVEDYFMKAKGKFPNRIIHLPNLFHPSTNFIRKTIAKKINNYQMNGNDSQNSFLNDISLAKNSNFPTDKIDKYEKIIIQVPNQFTNPHYHNINQFLNNDIEKDEKEPMIAVFQGRSAHGEQMMCRKYIQSKDDIHDLFSLVSSLYDDQNSL